MIFNELFMPGDRWLYVRIYTGYRMADEILLKVLYPLVNKLEHEQMILRWFFIRYADPDFHLRFRILLKDPAQASFILSAIRSDLAYYIENRILWKFESGTYHPEYERYGRHTIEYAEKIFHADSRSCLQFLAEAQAHTNPDQRWQFALLSADHLLNSFGICLAEKKDILLGLSRDYGKEYGKDKVLARQLSEKYRANRALIEDILGDHAPERWENILIRRETDYREEASLISKMSATGEYEIPMHDLLGSLIHMSMNRIFQTRNRIYEMVLYDFLFRHYKSALARANSPALCIS